MPKFEYKETAIILEIDGSEYELAHRTGSLEDELIKYEKSLEKMTEFEKYEKLISLLLGKGAVTKLFPNGKNENLDRMAQIAYFCQKEFNREIDELNLRRMKENLESAGVDMATDKLTDFNKSVDDLILKGSTLQKNSK